MTLSSSRRRAWEICESLELPTNSTLPELEATLSLRPSTEIIGRALVLSAVVSCSFGYSTEDALDWLHLHSLWHMLESDEQDFIALQEEPKIQQRKVECLYAFAWILGKIPVIDWAGYPPDDLVHVYPDLKELENPERFKSSVKLRTLREVMAELDVAYCLHWGTVQTWLMGEYRRLPGLIDERRRALEWSLSDLSWNEISLDT